MLARMLAEIEAGGISPLHAIESPSDDWTTAVAEHAVKYSKTLIVTDSNINGLHSIQIDMLVRKLSAQGLTALTHVLHGRSH